MEILSEARKEMLASEPVPGILYLSHYLLFILDMIQTSCLVLRSKQ